MRLISDVMQSILRSGMCAPTRPARGSWSVLALGALLVPLGACKPASGSAQAPAVELDDIVAIESELAMNAERLEAQGVRLAQVSQPKAAPADAGGEIADADDEADPALPAPPASPTEPEPEAEPVSEPEDDDAPAPSPARESSVGLTRSDRKAAKARKGSRQAPTRCERVCDLAEATCTLADRICGLADEHVDDVRYEDACARAQSQCEAASDACSACEE